MMRFYPLRPAPTHGGRPPATSTPPLPRRGARGRGSVRGTMVAAVAAMMVGALHVAGAAPAFAAPLASTTCTTTEMNFVAHEDDDLLFLNPDIYHSIAEGDCVHTVYFTAGDAGQGSSYWLGREAGIRAAYAEMAGVANTWTPTTLVVNNHALSEYVLAAQPTISLVFLNLPDGNGGNGSALYNYQTLKGLWLNQIPTITADDGSNTYTRSDLIATTLELMDYFQPQVIRTLDYAGDYTDADHYDHHTVAYIARAAHAMYTTPHTFTGYFDYQTEWMAPNVSGADLAAKTAAFETYDPNDLWDRIYLTQQYPRATESGGSSASLGACQQSQSLQLDSLSTGPLAGNHLWISGTVQLHGTPISSATTIYLTSQTLSFTANGQQYVVVLPDGQVTYDPSANTATTSYGISSPLGGLSWMTVAPAAHSNGNSDVFLTGFDVALPGAGLPSTLSNISWSATVSFPTTINADVSWNAQAYSQFASDYSQLTVVPMSAHNSNGHGSSNGAGTPTNEQAYQMTINSNHGDHGSSNDGTLTLPGMRLSC